VRQVLPFDTVSRETLLRTRIFDLERVARRSANTGQTTDYVNLAAPDWVNVVAVTRGGDLVLVRQERHGVCAMSLEIPGGMVDPGETPAQAALRELREETGYVGTQAVALGWVHPNPAIMSNRCHLFYAPDVELLHEPEPDGREEIEVSTVPLAKVRGMVASGEITHSLVICALYLHEIRTGTG